MADITMCLNRSCPNRSSCYRVTAKPGTWQAYTPFQPDEHGRCAHYIKSDNPGTGYDWENKHDRS